jgi:hypothetical protein
MSFIPFLTRLIPVLNSLLGEGNKTNCALSGHSNMYYAHAVFERDFVQCSRCIGYEGVEET